MKIKIIVIDFEIPRRTKRIAMRVALPVLVLLVISGVADSAVPYTFSAGDQLTSKSMNDNFADLDRRISPTGRFVVTISGGHPYSMGATTVCGTTAPTTGKILGPNSTTSFLAAKELCEAVPTCSASAHMCTSNELIAQAQMGLPLAATGWFSTGAVSSDPSQTQVWNDCNGWQAGAGTPTYIGPLWNGFTGWDGCSNQHAILCCD